MKNEKYALGLLLFTLRVVGMLFNYFVIRFLSATDFAIFSNFTAISNFSYQLGKLGTDIRFQGLLVKSSTNRKVYNSAYLIISVLMGFLCAVLAYYIIYPWFYKSEVTIEISFFSFLFFIMALFLGQMIISNILATKNLKLFFLYFFINLIVNVVFAIYLLTNNLKNFILFFAVLSLLCTLIVTIRCFEFKISPKKLELYKKIINKAIGTTLVVYINNIGISLVQLSIVGYLSWKNLGIIAEFRVLQSIQSVVVAFPMLVSMFLVNAHRRKNKQIDIFLQAHFYLVISSFVFFLSDVISHFYPQYKTTISEYLYLFLVFNVVTLISNSYMFIWYDTIMIKRYLRNLLACLVIALPLFFLYQLNSTRDFIIVDILIQLVFLLVLVFSSDVPSIFSGKKNMFSLIYIAFLFMFVSNSKTENIKYVSVAAFAVSSLYFIVFRRSDSEIA